MSFLDSVSSALSSTKLNSIVDQALSVYDSVTNVNKTPAKTTTTSPVAQNTTVSNVETKADKTMLYVAGGVGVLLLILLLK
jgi:hypothetical protein